MPTTLSTKPLFEPFTLKGLSLKNRIVMAPMTRSFSPNGIPTDKNAAYYAKRAQGGVGLILSEGTAVDHPAAQGYADVPHMYGDKALKGWKNTAEAVHKAGGKIFCQLWHVGAVRAPNYDPDFKTTPMVGATDRKHPGNPKQFPAPKALNENEIQEVIDGFAKSALNAKNAGLDGVEIHGAHGYLIDQFFWPETNLRSDGFGGLLNTRILFARELIRAMRRTVGPDFPIGFRFSQWKIRAYDARIADSPEKLDAWLSPLAEAGVDLFHASTQQFEKPEFQGSELTLAGWTKKLTGKPTIAVGKVGMSATFKDERLGAKAGKDAELAPVLERLAKGEFDLIAVGRALLGDAEWANKVKAGKLEDIRPYTADSVKTLD